MDIVTGLIYREKQNLPSFLYLLLILPTLFFILFLLFGNTRIDSKVLLLIAIAIALFDFIFLGFLGGMTLTVRWNEFVIEVGLFKLIRKKLNRGDIISVNVVNEPLWKKFGGWGIKGGFGTTAYIFTNGGGVEVKTSKSKILISSNNPQRLAEAIKSMG